MASISIANSAVPTASKKQPKRAAFAAFIGTTIEFYDFYIYAFASALIFGQLFFKTSNPFIGTMAAFATFAVGLFIKPVGGIVFGHIGDKIGRKRALIITLFLMGFATVGIGLLPTYSQAGILAPILLIAMRLLQGLAVGGEWGGAVLIAGEHAPDGRRGFFASFAQLGSPAGLILATLAFKFISDLPEEILYSYGWRLPFLASFVLLIIGFLIRHGVNESPEFLEQKEKEHTAPKAPTVEKSPLKQLLAKHKKLVVWALLANVIGVAGFYFVTTFMVAYTTQYLHINKDLVLNAILLVAVIHFFNTPFAAWVGEKVGMRKYLIIVSGLCCLFAYPMFVLVSQGTLLSITLGITLPMLCISSFYALIAGFTSSLFPVQLRYSGISLSYQFCGAIAGGLTPLIATSIAEYSNGSFLPLSLFLIALALASFIAMIALNTKKYPHY